MKWRQFYRRSVYGGASHRAGPIKNLWLNIKKWTIG